MKVLRVVLLTVSVAAVTVTSGAAEMAQEASPVPLPNWVYDAVPCETVARPANELIEAANHPDTSLNIAVENVIERDADEFQSIDLPSDNAVSDEDFASIEQFLWQYEACGGDESLEGTGLMTDSYAGVTIRDNAVDANLSVEEFVRGQEAARSAPSPSDFSVLDFRLLCILFQGWNLEDGTTGVVVGFTIFSPTSSGPDEYPTLDDGSPAPSDEFFFGYLTLEREDGKWLLADFAGLLDPAVVVPR